MKKHGKNSQPCILLILPAQNSFPFEISTFRKKILFHTSANIRINTFLWKLKTRVKLKLLHTFCAILFFFSSNKWKQITCAALFQRRRNSFENNNSKHPTGKKWKRETNCSAKSSPAKQFKRRLSCSRLNALLTEWFVSSYTCLNQRMINIEKHWKRLILFQKLNSIWPKVIAGLWKMKFWKTRNWNYNWTKIGCQSRVNVSVNI